MPSVIPNGSASTLSENLEVSDGITHSAYMALVEAVGPKYTERFVSADRLIADFRSLRIQSEIVLYARLCEISRNIMETALSNRVVTKGKTTLKDVALVDQGRAQEARIRRDVTASAGFPAVSGWK